MAEAVREIHDLQSLLHFLSRELAWPVAPGAPVEDVTFEWKPEELRVGGDQAARFKHGAVRQLRPFTSTQPWGVFLVEFADGQIYRTALRQVLRGLVPTRRRASHLPAWDHEDLLFICTTSGYDRFTFAHFRGEHYRKARLATFSWQQGDRYVRTLCQYNLPSLHFPEDGGQDATAWRTSWAKGFDKEPLTREFFKRFEQSLAAIKADLEKYQSLRSQEAYSRG
jgi:hypothetical protein